jgi:hypothetical protein
MTLSAPPAPRRPFRSAWRIFALLSCFASAPVLAQEPLFIRIRPFSDADSARAAREVLWARRQAHARTIIESVCSGCLGAWKPADEPEPAPVPVRIANLPLPTGVEVDPGSGASDQHSDPATPERLP